MSKLSSLENVSIVLVDTKTPANIGATARVMMNMGLNTMVLVNPPKDKDRDAYKLAAGAHDIIDKASVFPTLKDAVSGHGFVIGTSRHAGKQRQNIRFPRDAAEQVIALLPKNRVAVVFGNEVNGLETRDLALCQEIVAIPSSTAFPSLNLSHAVMVIAYELYLASGARNGRRQGGELAHIEDLENLFSHLRNTLQTIGFLERDHPERLMFSIRQMFGRTRLTGRNVAILRGILSAVDRVARRDNNGR